MDLQIIILHKVSQTKTNIAYYHLYVEFENNANELIYETEIDSETQKPNLWLPKGEGGEKDKLGVGA